MPIDLSQITLDRTIAMPLARQLHGHIHQQIIQGQWLFAERLPATRVLAEALNISRGVVVECYEMLRLDGLVLGVGKGGTQICYQPTPLMRSKPSTHTSLNLSQRGQTIATARRYKLNHTPDLLQTSLPDLQLFPLKQWLNLQREAWQSTQGYYQRQGGVLSLKQALRDFLARYRGIQVPDLKCLLITTGTQGALSALAQVLANQGDMAIVENPCWEGCKAALSQADLTLKTVEVDTAGAQLPDYKAKLAILTPNAQYPTGYVMSVARREAWLEYSHRHSTWLIEDDYAAEYSYNQHPAPSLLSYPQAQQVIHVGTMSKLLLPDLRLGWMVVPPALADSMAQVLNTLGLQPSYLLQQQLALFIQYGYLGNHLASTRAIYNQRRQVCTEYLEQKGREVLQVMPSVSGMNTYVRLHQPFEAQVLKQRLQQAGLGGEVYEVLENNTPHTYVLFGHARLTLEQMPSALEYLLQVLRH
ncbi:MAG: hypothetical protein RLZZ422_2034 [Pseudomonadota bacterium]|jgi:GntR family transcriptional regulator/MocR family aminotransferase